MNPNSYSNQKFHYQAKEQFGQYSETQNESYQSSEGPPSVQVKSINDNDLNCEQ